MLTNMIQQAGPLGKVLVILSVLSLGVILERSWFWIKKGKPVSDRLRRGWLCRLQKGMNPKATLTSPEGRAIAFLYEHRAETDEKLLDVALSREVRETTRFLALLDTNAAAAPMIGILGTVLGIIQAFSGMKGDAPDTGLMVSGISVAMLTTAIGLIVALVSLVSFNAFSARAHKRQTETAELLHEGWMALVGKGAQGQGLTTESTKTQSEPISNND